MEWHKFHVLAVNSTKIKKPFGCLQMFVIIILFPLHSRCTIIINIANLLFSICEEMRAGKRSKMCASHLSLIDVLLDAQLFYTQFFMNFSTHISSIRPNFTEPQHSLARRIGIIFMRPFLEGYILFPFGYGCYNMVRMNIYISVYRKVFRLYEDVFILSSFKIVHIYHFLLKNTTQKCVSNINVTA